MQSRRFLLKRWQTPRIMNLTYDSRDTLHELRNSFPESNYHFMNRCWFSNAITSILTQTIADTKNSSRIMNLMYDSRDTLHELRNSFPESNYHFMNRCWFSNAITSILTQTMADIKN